MTELLPLAETRWITLLNGSENEQLAALEIIPDIKHIVTSVTRKDIEQACQTSTIRIFHTQNSAAKILILNAYRFWQGQCNHDIQELIMDALEHNDPGVRAAAVQCVHLIPKELHYNKLECALSDGHINVRNKAIEALRKETPDATILALKWISEDNRGTPRAQETLLNAIISAVPLSTLKSIINNKIKK